MHIMKEVLKVSMGTMIIIIIIYYVTEAEKQTVKLIKWYKTLVNEIDFDKNGMVEKLSARGVISMEDCTTLKSEKNTQKEKNREILENIIRKNISSASTIFLEILKEDSCYSEYATRIGETDVTQRDLELLYIGMLSKTNH